MRLLLIGGTGFIGRRVANVLEHLGHDVAVFHRGSGRSARRAVVGDRRRLLDHAPALRALKPDVVIDLILSSGTQARETMTVFRGHTERVVAVSSCDVYRAWGIIHGSEAGPVEPLPLKESSALRTTLQIYPRERVRVLQQVFSWLDEEYDKIPVEWEVLSDRDTPGTVVRLPMVYGAGDPLHRLFPIVRRMDDRRAAILFDEQFARWRSPRGHVENVAAAIAVAAVDGRAAGRTYNVGDADNLSELAWARQIATVAGWDGEFVVMPAERMPDHLRSTGNFSQHAVTDTTRIRQELGYQEPIARDEALRRTIEWERANPPAVDPRAFDYAAEDAAIAARP